jgi:hypothetical protein
MTKTLSIRLPSNLILKLKAKTKAAKTNPTAVLRRMAAEYVRTAKPAITVTPEHVHSHAGSWKGFCSGEELLRRTRR